MLFTVAQVPLFLETFLSCFGLYLHKSATQLLLNCRQRAHEVTFWKHQRRSLALSDGLCEGASARQTCALFPEISSILKIAAAAATGCPTFKDV